MGPVAPQDDIWIVLPSLNPGERFDRVVDGLVDAGFSHILIVNDGSRPDCLGHFARAAAYPQCTVLTHEVNRGKGAALKTAFGYLAANCPDAAGAVTVDGDGQHLTGDILRCAAALSGPDSIVLGCRDFSGADVPKRSSMGNRITSTVFRLLCGIRLSDTQTGLRAVPAELFPRLLTIRGERFEYETNMLLELSRAGVKLREVPITTVYEDGNSESHFHPVLDSLRIYKFILLYVLSSLSGSLTDLLVFYFARLLLQIGPVTDGNMTEARAVLFATVIARAISSLVNYTLNSVLVFRGRSGGRSLLRYYTLAVCLMLVSAGLVALLSRLAGTGASFLTTLIKFAVDTCLFFLSFRIQQTWVFRETRRTSGGDA